MQIRGAVQVSQEGLSFRRGLWNRRVFIWLRDCSRIRRMRSVAGSIVREQTKLPTWRTIRRNMEMVRNSAGHVN